MDRLADPENPKIKKKNQLIRSSIYKENKVQETKDHIAKSEKITYKTRVKIMMNRKNKE